MAPSPATTARFLFATNDASNAMQLGPSTGLARIVYRDTNTFWAISRSKNGSLFIAERGLGHRTAGASAEDGRPYSTASRSNASLAS